LPYAIVADDISSGTLIAKPLPFDLAPAETSMAWHNSNDRDLGLHWLRATIKTITENKFLPLTKKLKNLGYI